MPKKRWLNGQVEGSSLRVDIAMKLFNWFKPVSHETRVDRVTVTKVDRKPKPSINDNLHCKLAKEVAELRKAGAL